MRQGLDALCEPSPGAHGTRRGSIQGAHPVDIRRTGKEVFQPSTRIHPALGCSGNGAGLRRSGSSLSPPVVIPKPGWNKQKGRHQRAAPSHAYPIV